MKRKRKLHNFLLRCVTDVAIFNCCAGWFAYDLWPVKSVVAIFASLTWLMLFAEANKYEYFEED